MKTAPAKKLYGEGFSRPCTERSPERVWRVTDWDGTTPLWSSRAWETGERAKYCRNVLGREPFSGEN